MADIKRFFCHVFAAFIEALGYGGPTDSQLDDLDLGRNSDEDLGGSIWRISTWDILKDMFGISMGYLWDIYVGDV